jgi:hypothetical protein
MLRTLRATEPARRNQNPNFLALETTLNSSIVPNLEPSTLKIIQYQEETIFRVFSNFCDEVGPTWCVGVERSFGEADFHFGTLNLPRGLNKLSFRMPYIQLCFSMAQPRPVRPGARLLFHQPAPGLKAVVKVYMSGQRYGRCLQVINI